MAFTFQGTGTSFIGKRDFRADGTYITTEWFVFFLIPIFPLRSVRVQEAGRKGSFIYSKEYYKVYESGKPNTRQVLYVYGFALLFGFWVVFLASFDNFLDRATKESFANIAWVLALFAPLLLPFFLRSYAKRTVRN